MIFQSLKLKRFLHLHLKYILKYIPIRKILISAQSLIKSCIPVKKAENRGEKEGGVSKEK